MEPLVSVVVPVFNGLPHLRELTESLLSQTYGNLDIVFSEGGGSDQSWEFLQSLSDVRIRLIQMPTDTSAAENWTAATLAARGEFVKLVCQDDLLYPKAVAHQVSDLLSHPDAVMAIAQRDIVDAAGAVLFPGRGLSGVRGASGDALSGSLLIRTCYLQGTNVLGEPLSVLFRADALRSAMPWDDSNPLMLDLSTYSKVAPLGDVVVRRESIGAFRVSSSSWSTRLARQQVSQTRVWQAQYAATATPAVGAVERARAAIGRHVQTSLRRAAYAYLRARRAMTVGESHT